MSDSIPTAGEIILAVRKLKGDELGLVAYIIQVRDVALAAVPAEGKR